MLGHSRPIALFTSLRDEKRAMGTPENDVGTVSVYNRLYKFIISVYINFQLKQPERRSLKKIRASTGFEPVTSAIPVRCSTN